MINAKRIDSEELPRINPLISHGVLAGNLLVTSAEAGKNDDGTLPATVEEQMDNSFRQISRILEAAGGTLDNVIRVEGYITDVAYAGKFNDAYNRYFANAPVPPARFTVEIKFPNPSIFVEIAVIAVIG